MLFLLSPAKALDFEKPVPPVPLTRPVFVAQSAQLIDLLKKKSSDQIAGLMGLSGTLAELNTARYAAWRPRFTAHNSKPAVLAFNGDVYAGLDAVSLPAADLQWLQDHVCILSGLHGVLRPLDRMQAYRLEMGAPLANSGGKDLYQFWRAHITGYLNERLHGDVTPVVVNLASQEYFKAVDQKALKARVIDCVFEDWSDGKYRVVGFHAKRARGLMTRYAAQHQVLLPRQLEQFNAEGYEFAAAASKAGRLVFRRRHRP